MGSARGVCSKEVSPDGQTLSQTRPSSFSLGSSPRQKPDSPSVSLSRLIAFTSSILAQAGGWRVQCNTTGSGLRGWICPLLGLGHPFVTQATLRGPLVLTCSLTYRTPLHVLWHCVPALCTGWWRRAGGRAGPSLAGKLGHSGQEAER